MFLKKMTKINILKIFLLFSFGICWLSISTSFEDLLIFNKEKNFEFKIVVNFFRHFFVYFCFLSLLIITTIYKKKINFKKYFIFYIFLAYLISQVPGLFLSNNLITNTSFLISSSTVIFSLVLIDTFFSHKEKKSILLFSFITLTFVFFLTFIPKFTEFLNGGNIFYGIHMNSPIFLDKYSPRSSGLARTALIIFIFINLFENTFFKKKINIITITKIFFLTFILLFQSRTAIFLTILVITLIFLNENNLNFNNFSKFLFLYIIIPIILFILLSVINSSQRLNGLIEKKEKGNIVELLKSKKLVTLRKISKEDPSSGRFNDWDEIFTKFSNKNIIYGYGAQGDRYLINQSASNGLIYAFSSSGLIGLTFFVIFSIIVSFKVLKIFFYCYKKNTEYILYITVITILFLRSILESSYAVFGLDQIVIFTFLVFIINIDFKKINSKI